MYLSDADISLPVGLGMWLIVIVLLVSAIRNMYDCSRAESVRPASGRYMLYYVSCALVLLILRACGVSSDGLYIIIYMAVVAVTCALAGRYAAMVTCAVTVAVQTMVYADGGILALGCNIFNFAVLPTLVIWPVAERFFHSPGYIYVTLRVASATVFSGVLVSLTSWFERWLSLYAQAGALDNTTFCESLRSTTAIFPSYDSPVAVVAGFGIISGVLALLLPRPRRSFTRNIH